jgi:hypothetical protein
MKPEFYRVKKGGEFTCVLMEVILEHCFSTALELSVPLSSFCRG